jgi:FkbM family methyltransferase
VRVVDYTMLFDRTYELLARSRWVVRAAVHARGIASAVIGKRLAPTTLADRNGEYRLLRELGGSTRVVVDVGANVGDWSAAAMGCWQELERVLCFEPGEWAAERLERRFADDDRVTVIRRALSDAPEELRFWEEPSGGTMSSVVAGYSGVDSVARTVAATTLDAELSALEVDRVDVLKIDTEGFDLRVLRGASGMLSNGKIDVVQFEYSSAWQDAGCTLREAYTLLEGAGLRVLAITPRGLRAFRADAISELFVYANFVGLSPSRAKRFAHVPPPW